MQISDISDKVQVNSHKNAKVAQTTKRDFQQKENTRKHQTEFNNRLHEAEESVNLNPSTGTHLISSKKTV